MRVEAFNAFNWFQWGNPDTAVQQRRRSARLRASAAIHRVIMQFALKYTF